MPNQQLKIIKCRGLCSVLLMLGLCLFGSAVHAAQTMDIIITGGRIYTLALRPAFVLAMGVRDEKIAFAGMPDFVKKLTGPQTTVINLGQGICIPGLVDAHAHLANLGKYLSRIRLVGSASASEARDSAIARIALAASGEWILGRGWDQNDWPIKEFPAWRDLSGTESHPVCLKRVDGHAYWVNKTAFELCGVTSATPDPEGGRILRDSTGEPTGIFLDNALELIDRHIPEPSASQLSAMYASALREFARYGLTGVHDAGLDSAGVAVCKELAKSGKLTARAYGMLDMTDTNWVKREMAKPPFVTNDEILTLRALKIYADGALGSRGAALLAPYSDDTANVGLLISDRAAIERWATLAMKSGYQVCTHAIGDRANRLTLDAYQAALRTTSVRDTRPRIEHAQVIAPEDISRFAKLGVIASMQPTHCTSDMYWAEDRLGAERAKGAYAWRTLEESGAYLCFGSDCPVEDLNPLLGIYAAATRRDLKGWPEGGWHREQSLSVENAVRAFTQGAAYASFNEKKTGTIEFGKWADLTILDRDIFSCPVEEIPLAKVLYTIVAGRIVYQAPDTGGDEKE